MSNRVFFSWQSDTEAKYNRNFIKKCINLATVKLLNSKDMEFQYDEATRSRVGTIDIAESILHKITESTVFIADITIIDGAEEIHRKTPNPNVMLELGFAASVIGWDNIILMFNLSKGNWEDIPFDIRNRRILSYTFGGEDDEKSCSNDMINNLVSILSLMDFDNVRRRERINRAYSNESNHIRFYAMHNFRSDYWHAKLLSELLKDVRGQIEQENELVQSGVIFNAPKSVSVEQFVDWLTHNFDMQTKYLKTLELLVEHRLLESVNSSDPVKILHYSQTIGRVGDKLLGFELERLSLVVPEPLEKYKKFVGTNVEGFINLLERLIDILDSLYKEKNDTIKLSSSDLDPIFNFDSSMMKEITDVCIEIMTGRN